MIRVLIVDDEPPARRKVRRFLELDAEIGAIGEVGSGAEAIDAIRAFAPDLVFLDVQMPDMDGFAVLRAVPEPHEFHVVFLTAHGHHALRAFESEALDYLLKPADPERFERALERAKEQVALRRERDPKPEPARFLKRILVEKGGREMLSAGGAPGLGGIRPQLRSTSFGRRRVRHPRNAGEPRPAARPGAIRAHQPFGAGQSRPHQGDAALVPRRTADRAARRPRVDVDAPLPGLFIPRLGPLVPGVLATAAPATQNAGMRTFALSFLLACGAAVSVGAADNGWSFYGGDAAGTRYSPLKQITRENIAHLKAVWTYHTGALSPKTDRNEKAAFEATPILIEGTLYLTTPFNAVIALDPATKPGSGSSTPTWIARTDILKSRLARRRARIDRQGPPAGRARLPPPHLSKPD